MAADLELLDDRGGIQKADRAGMLPVVERWPEMLAQAVGFSAGVSLSPRQNIRQVVICGMGGSAIAGDIAADMLFNKLPVPLIINRGYNLPNFVGSETLVIALSYSGETEETLAAVRDAEKRGAQLICISSGGKLTEIARNKKYPLFTVPAGFQPRAALPYLLVPLLLALEKAGLTTAVERELNEVVGQLQKLREEYGSQRPAKINPAKQLAKKLVGKIPLIFGSVGTTAACALRLKGQLNENSKVAAHVALFPELDHNEIVSLAALKREDHNFSLLVLRDEGDSERIKKRIEITKSLLSRQLGGITDLSSQGKSPLAKMLSLIFFGDYLSVYLALLNGIDPTPVDIITRLKKELLR